MLKSGGSIDGIASGPRRMLATAGQGGVALWDLHRPRTPVRKLCTQGLRWASRSRADGAKLATAGADGTVGLWDLIHRLVSFADHYRGQVNAVAFSADGHILASVGSAGPGRGGGLCARSVTCRSYQGPLSRMSGKPSRTWRRAPESWHHKLDDGILVDDVEPWAGAAGSHNLFDGVPVTHEARQPVPRREIALAADLENA
jgi:hypothetical protein